MDFLVEQDGLYRLRESVLFRLKAELMKTGGFTPTEDSPIKLRQEWDITEISLIGNKPDGFRVSLKDNYSKPRIFNLESDRFYADDYFVIMAAIRQKAIRDSITKAAEFADTKTIATN